MQGRPDLIERISLVAQIPQVRAIFEEQLAAVERLYEFEIDNLDRNLVVVSQNQDCYDTLKIENPGLVKYVRALHEFPDFGKRRAAEFRVIQKVSNSVSTN